MKKLSIKQMFGRKIYATPEAALAGMLGKVVRPPQKTQPKKPAKPRK